MTHWLNQKLNFKNLEDDIIESCHIENNSKVVIKVNPTLFKKVLGKNLDLN